MASSKKTSKAKIVPPAGVVDPVEIPPEKEKFSSNTSDGVRLIEWIYNFFALHEPLMYMVYSKYKKLGINFLWNFFFSLFSYIVDSIYVIFVYLMVGLIIIIIVYSFGKLVGFWDFVGGIQISSIIAPHSH
jgi:hypothetical protein